MTIISKFFLILIFFLNCSKKEYLSKDLDPLIYYAIIGDLEEIYILLEDEDYYINSQNDMGDVAISKALQYKHYGIVEYLLERGADLNIPNFRGITPFIYLVTEAPLQLIKRAIIKGGAINKSYFDLKTQRKNFTALQYAILYNRLDVVKVLSENGGNPFVMVEGKNCFNLSNKKPKIKQYLKKKFNYVFKESLESL